MRLKCIKLAGFKSFVDPTTVNFPSSLCAVVGPNGCGKSNVIDAVRWVMGESSAKNLRGENMTDVIFNGSGARKPVGQASVELVFDNSDHRLTGEYANFTEVSIKRRVDRDAQSSYFLNGSKCRRRDITDIFLGTGLGARSYSIIEQGMVSRLIESKPEELRIFIEEAAGISKYKERRRETENRIKRTKENLERLTDIRDELERQLQHLHRQSIAAEKYGELKKQERETTANLNAIRWQNLSDELEQNQQGINALELEIESTTAEQTEIDARVEKHLADNSEFTDAMGEVQAKFYSLGNDIARIEQSIEHHLERAEQLKQDLQETEESWEHNREELDLDLQRVTTLDAEMGTLLPDLEEALGLERQSGQSLEAAEQAMADWQQQWDEFNQEAEEPRQIAEVEQSRIQQLEKIVERGLERKQKLEQELNGLSNQPQDDSAGLMAQEITSVEIELESQQGENTNLTKRIEHDRNQLQQFSLQLDEVRSALQTAKGRQASLTALQQAALGEDDENISNWLDSKGIDSSNRLGQSISVEPGWEMAVEAVLGDTLQSVCVDDIDNLQQLLSELPDGLLSLVETSSSGTADAAPGLDSLAKKVSAGWNTSGLLPGIYCAENLQQALTLRSRLGSGESVVTRQGVWLSNSWLRVRQGTDAQAGVLKRKGQLSEIDFEINQLQSEEEELLGLQRNSREALAENEKQRENLQQLLGESNRKHSEMKSEYSAHLATLEQAGLRRQRISHELEELGRQLELEQDNTGTARNRLQEALDNMENDVSRRLELEQQREARIQALQGSREKGRADKDQAHELALRKQAVESQLQSTRETMDRMASQVQRSKERIESLSQQISDADEPLTKMRDDLQQLLQQRLEVENELDLAKAKVDGNEHAIRELEQQRNQVLQRITKHRENLMEKRLKSEGASVKRDGILEQLKEVGFDLEQVLANLPEGLEEAECAQELEKLGNRIQRLGAINLAAIDEYKQQSERKVYLDSQNEDLEKALATLHNAIKKIDKETRSRFKETFDKINSGLQKLFPRVFGGGHAYLDMTGEDLLDTGVAIMARPPGKRNSTIHLLSGGEKAMTAIALVFSIFQLNPSPFCMLDEVDAPLDDANVGRYANLVKEMSANVQFIFITHNKITMEMANQLLGVTMHEPGVSRIVAVDIDEAAELAAM